MAEPTEREDADERVHVNAADHERVHVNAAHEPPELAPIEVNAARIIFIGTAIWAVGFLALLPFYSELGRHHHRIWLWTCLAGVGVGLFAYVLMRRHRAAGRTT